MAEIGDEPLTPAGRLFLQPETSQIIHCVVGLKNPVDVDSVKSEINNSILLQHPRFTSLMVRDHRGIEHWRPTQIDIDRHLLIIDDPVSDDYADDESATNHYLGDLCTASTSLSMDKPLWEIHILRAHKCVIFRIHHSLGDGISLMSMLLASCRKVQDPNALPTLSLGPNKPPSKFSLRDFLFTICLSFLYVLQFILRCLWIRDGKTPITGGSGVDLWPRKIATATLSLEHMKTVKRAVHNAVIPFLPTSLFFYSIFTSIYPHFR